MWRLCVAGIRFAMPDEEKGTAMGEHAIVAPGLIEKV